MATDTKREPRPEKVETVSDIKDRLESSRAVFVTEYRGLSVAEQQRLRRALREASAEYKIYKMTLARRAESEAGFEELLDMLEGPTGIAFVADDPVMAAKAMKDIAGAVDAFVLKGGVLAGGIVDAAQIRELADVEPRDVQLAKMAGLLIASLQNMAGVMNSMLGGFASMMDQLADKKQSGEAPAPAVEEQAAEEPAAEEPVAEEPAAEESEADEPAASEEASAEEPTNDQTSTDDEENTEE